jgi:hypothetical protein
LISKFSGGQSSFLRPGRVTTVLARNPDTIPRKIDDFSVGTSSYLLVHRNVVFQRSGELTTKLFLKIP